MARELPYAFGDYVLLTRLGAGAAAEAFLARPIDPDAGLPTPIVIKRLHGFSDDPELEARFRHEADLATQVESPFLPRIFDVGTVDDVLYFALEYVEGWTIHRILKELESSKRKASVPSALGVALDVLSGLQALHESDLGIVHRDVSPKNIILGADGRARLIDLGIGWSKLKTFQTATGAVLGSPGYMAPEQVRADPIDARTDLYAVGILLFELLTLENYVPRGPLHTMLMWSANPSFRPVRPRRSEVPAVMDEILQKALDPVLDRRFPSASAFRRALEAVPGAPRRGPPAISNLPPKKPATKRPKQVELEAETQAMTLPGGGVSDSFGQALIDPSLVEENATERHSLRQLIDASSSVSPSPARTQIYARRGSGSATPEPPTDSFSLDPAVAAAARPTEPAPTDGSTRVARPVRIPSTLSTPDPAEVASSEEWTRSESPDESADGPEVTEVPTQAPVPTKQRRRRLSDASFAVATSLVVVPIMITVGVHFGQDPGTIEAPTQVVDPEPKSEVPAELHARTATAPPVSDPPPDDLEKRSPEPPPVEQVRAPPKVPRETAKAVPRDRKPAKEMPAQPPPVPEALDVRTLTEKARAARQRWKPGSEERASADRILGELLRWSETEDDAEEHLHRLSAEIKKLELK